MAQGQAMTSTATETAKARPDATDQREIQMRNVASARAKDDGNEDGADAIGELLHGSSRGLRLFDEAHHLAENAVGADGGGAVFEGAVEIERAADDAIAGLSRDGERFAGDQRFVDGGDAGEDEAVDGDALAGTEDDDVAGDDLGEGNFDFVTFAQKVRRLRLELHECVQGIEGAALRAGIEPAAEQKKAENQEDRVVVDVGVEAVAVEDAGHGGGGERIREVPRRCPEPRACSYSWRGGWPQSRPADR